MSAPAPGTPAGSWRRGLAPLLLGALLQGCAANYLEPEEGGVDHALQGEYTAAGAPWALQVVALGEGAFRGVFLAGGLPGGGADGGERVEVEGRRSGALLRLEGEPWAEIRDGAALLRAADGTRYALPRVQRESPTLGEAAPAGAVVLFDGSGLDQIDGEVDERGLLHAGAVSRRSFGSFHAHLEFRVPFGPELAGQRRGNSGVYLQERYELQVLDSFGLPPDARGCGAIYGQRPPDVNMSLPPLAWQTYDIDFSEARFDDDGRRVAPARVTLLHNGVLVHDRVALDGPTGRGDAESPAPGRLLLQDHWSPVYYRNVWVVPRED